MKKETFISENKITYFLGSLLSIKPLLSFIAQESQVKAEIHYDKIPKNVLCLVVAVGA